MLASDFKTWDECQGRFNTLMAELREQLVALTESKPVLPLPSGEVFEALAYIHAYGLDSLSTVRITTPKKL